MAFKSLPNVGQQTIVSYKIEGAITDADLGKPVKLTGADIVTLCADGDPIYGFLSSIEVHPVDGKVFVGVIVQGRVRCTLSGAVTLGLTVEAAANTAAGTAIGQNWGIVSVHTPDTTSAVTLLATTHKKHWTLISGTGADNADGVLECF